MNRFRLIVDALSSLIIPNDKIRELAHNRGAKCSECPFNKQNFCTECKCFIPLKILSVRDKCPKDKW